MDKVDPIPTGRSRPSLCATYLLLGGTSGYALKQAISSSSTYAMGTFGYLLGYSLFGFAHSILAEPSYPVRFIVHHGTWLAVIVPFALINAELYTLNSFPPEYAYVHLASPILPIAYLCLRTESNILAMDAVFYGNLVSLGYLQFTKQTGAWTYGLILVNALNHFLISFFMGFEFPQAEILTVRLSVFAVIALQALKNLKA